jgi:kynurenine formamidase
MTRRLIDLTHTFDCAMPAFPADPHARLCQIATLEGNGFNEFHLETNLHIGTHIDAPFHMIDGGNLISDIDLSALSGRGHLIDVRGATSFPAEVLDECQINPGDIVLFFSGFSEYFRMPRYYNDYPEFSLALADRLVTAGVRMVGMDTPSPDRPPFPIHKTLLSRNILIIENLTNLEHLLKAPQFTVQAYPLKLQADASPARVIAEVL